MIGSILKGSSWAHLLDYVSPAFFEVIPTRQLWNAGTGLASRSRNSALRESCLAARASEFQKSGLPVCPQAQPSSSRAGKGRSADAGSADQISTNLSLERDDGELVASLDSSQKQLLGHSLLRIYFHQIFNPGCVLLDMRPSGFALPKNASQFVWTQSGLLGEFSNEFRSALCDVYRGYYFSDNVLFDQGLEQLKLTPAKELFLKHFGTGNNGLVSFEMKNFLADFHDIFLLCRDHKISLHSDFVQLGVYLALLYEHLEKLGQAQNVQQAFLETVS